MIITVYISCEDHEKYSKNGINLEFHRVHGENYVTLSFEDDAGKKLFEATADINEFMQAVGKL